MKKYLFFFGILACSAICSGQIRVQIEDISDLASPVHISGAISFDDDASRVIRYSYQVHGLVANASKLGVMLVVVHVEGGGLNGPSLDYTYQKDYFFDPNILQPGKEEEFHSSPLMFGAARVNGQVVSEDNIGGPGPTATAQVMFVQFADGSTWGDGESGKEPLTVRNQTIRELDRLEGVLKKDGDQALKKELSESANLACIDSLISGCRDKLDSCLVDGLRFMVKTAKQHEIEMKAKSGVLDESISRR